MQFENLLKLHQIDLIRLKLFLCFQFFFVVETSGLLWNQLLSLSRFACSEVIITSCNSKQPHLRLREAQLRSQLGSLRQGQVLGRLEPPLQDRQLVAGVDGSGFTHLLRLPVDQPNLQVRFLFHWKETNKQQNNNN